MSAPRPDPALPLYLTFDDGPSPEGTPPLLSALGRAAARATFFVLGPAAREHPDLIERILESGHRVELHGEAHLDHRSVDADALAADTDAAIETLRRLTGARPTWWRVPWGRLGPATESVAAANGLRIVGWHADTHDWRGDGWADQGHAVRAAASRGGIVLLHDGLGPGATRTGFANGVELLGGLLHGAARAGIAVEALPDAHAPAAIGLPHLPLGPRTPAPATLTGPAGAWVAARNLEVPA